MIKCLLLGHKWEYRRTDVGKRKTYYGLIKKEFEHDLANEYYQCAKCGLWKQKVFIDHQLEETKYFAECPIERCEK